MNIQFLSNNIPWFGNHTGYEQLPLFFQTFHRKIQTISPKNKLLYRCIGKVYSVYRRWPKCNPYNAAAELQFFLSIRNKPDSIHHILYLENHLLFLDKWAKASGNIMGTIHLPPSQWNPTMLENLKRLSSAIVLYQRDLNFFENYIGKNRVQFIHHGVDTEFFYPIKQELSQSKRILFAGHYLRNTAMLHRVVVRLAERYPELRFDLLVPEQARHAEGLLKLSNHPSENFTREVICCYCL